MKNLFISLLLFFTMVFSYSIVAQDMGSIQKITNFSTPEKIMESRGDPLPAGTYSIGSGGDFLTIDSAFNKLSIDGIAGEVTLELIDNLYTAPTDTFGFLLIGPIAGAGENSRIIIKPAQNHQVTIEGDGGAVLYFSNTSYVTLDGVTLTGPTSLTINSIYNSQFTWNDCVDFLDDSDHNLVTTINVNCGDYTRPSDAIGFYTNSSGVAVAPDSNLIENNNIIQGTLGIYVSSYWSSAYAIGNIVRNNLVSAPSGYNITFGMQLEKNENTIVEKNVVNNIMNSAANLELALGINAHWCNGCTIRNNVVHSISSDVMNGSTGILLSGVVGHEGFDNMIYNNMIYDIQSTSANANSRVTGIQTWQNHNPKVYYNSIHLSGTGSNIMGSGALYIRTNTTDMEAYDNIFVNTRDESIYCASSIFTSEYVGSLTSDYNDLHFQSSQYNCIVRAASHYYLSLEEWQATGHDVSSISEMPNFSDPLHIDEGIPTNLESGGIPIAGIDTDIDGDLRHAVTPDIGADEFSGTIVPVELASFTASTSNGRAYLSWSTATEINNQGFEIQRKIDNSEWTVRGFRNGAGTITEPQSYSFIDELNEIASTSISYRLKQVDFDGSFEYSEEVLIDNPAPADFSLQQNYPNPFNPSTAITFGIPVKTHVVLKVFSSVGEEVMQLCNGEKEAGKYSVEFDAGTLSSGIYFYQLKAGSFIETRKMLLLK